MVETEQAELEAALGHRFREPAWLEQALTHSSRLPELDADQARQDNEKLEFLGDAILGALVSEHLVTTFPDWKEGQLSKGRASLVNAATLHAAARRLGLGRHLRLGRGEEKTGGREKPTVLADAYEAIVAAIYLDAGLDAARHFVERSLLDEAMASESGRLDQSDDKSALQEYLQARGSSPASYHVLSEEGPEHRRTFVVEVRVGSRQLATGVGGSKKEAEQAAARTALGEFLRKNR